MEPLFNALHNLQFVFHGYRDLDDSNSIYESVETLDEGSLASFGSGNTTDSDKVSGFLELVSFLLILIATFKVGSVLNA